MSKTQLEIGELDPVGDGTFTIKRTDKDLNRNTNSLGMSLAFLQNEAIKFRWILIKYNQHQRNLITTRNFFLSKGTIQKSKKLTTQIYLPIKLFGINLAKEFDRKEALAIHNKLFEVA